MFVRPAASYAPTQEGDLRLWLDASIASSMTLSGSQVTAWASRVHGVSMVRGVLGPVYGATAWDGVRPCVTFNSGAYSDLRANSVTGLTDFFGDTGQACTFVARFISPTGGSGFLVQSYSSGGSYAALEDRFLSPNFNVFWSSGGAHATGTASYTTAVSATTALVTDGLNNVATYKNGSTADIAPTAFTPAAVSDLSIGGGALLGNNGMSVQIAEVLLYHSALSTAALARVHAYLAAKWP